jgi:16S rRNA (adenine1518-N6/adenine1519-N6)-dimethyltransferase
MLDRHGLHLSRDLGQNFLVDESVADRLAMLAGVGSEDAVIEVGTGLGVLTRALARRARRVLTVEIDSGLVAALQADELLPETVTLLHADALEIDWPTILAELTPPVRVVANLPYSVATPLLRRLIDYREELQDWSVMVQLELAQRLQAPVGSKDYGSFAVLHALTVDVSTQMELAPESFFPAPKVRSAFVRVWPRSTPLLEPGELPKVERVVRAAFAQRRKTILNCLRAGALVAGNDREVLGDALAKADIDPRARAEAVPPEQLLALARAIG